MLANTVPVRLFDEDADLLRRVPAEHAQAARDRVVVDALVLPHGRVAPQVLDRPATGFAWLVVNGLLTRRVEVLERTAVEVVGPGDVLPAQGCDDTQVTVPTTRVLKALVDARVALLDGRFARVAAQLPGVLTELVARLGRRTDELAVQLAIAQLPRLEHRLLLVLWRLAQRFGTAGPHGMVLELPLSQQALGELVAAQRSSVNVALSALCQRGLVVQGPGSEWLLNGPPPAAWPNTSPAGEGVGGAPRFRPSTRPIV